MKICHMTSAHDSDDIRIFHKECVSLAKIPEYEVYLVAAGNSRLEKNVNVIGIGEKPAKRFDRMFGFSKKVYEAALEIDADIYHFHDPELLPYGKKLKKIGKTVIFDSHENTSKQIMLKGYIPKVVRKIISKLYRHMETSVCRKLDAVIFPATDIKETGFVGRAKRIVLVDNLPMLDELKIDESKKQERTYCCVGTLSEERGVTQMLKAAKHINGKLILAGHFAPSEYKDALMSQGLLDDVDYRGVVDRAEVVNIYNQSQVGVSTLLHVGQYESLVNFATKEYEYMAMGIPVVRTDFASNHDTFIYYDFGIGIDPEDPMSIAGAVNYLFDNPEIREKKGNNGLNAAKNRFNWEFEIKKIYELYETTGKGKC